MVGAILHFLPLHLDECGAIYSTGLIKVAVDSKVVKSDITKKQFLLQLYEQTWAAAMFAASAQGIDFKNDIQLLFEYLRVTKEHYIVK